MQRRLRLSLLGTFQATLDGEANTRFEYDKVRALLAYLAVESEIPHRRDTLTGLLWPEQTDSLARRSLNQALYTLRKVLGDQEAPAVPFILTNRSAVQLNPEADVRLDVHAFAGLVGEQMQAGAAEMTPDRLDRLREALRLYRGDLLQGLSIPDSIPFEEWTVLQRERLHRKAMEALQLLASHHEWRGELAEATDYLRRQTELEPWQEEAHRQLMRILAHRGQRSAALRQYELCRQTLENELGLEPSRETSALADRIRQNDGQKHHNLPAQLTPFVGRSTELASIARLLAQPDCRVLALLGPGGAGKTRLALQVTEQIKFRFLDGVWFVSLAEARTLNTLPLAIAEALNFSPTKQSTLLPELLDYLRQKEMLLLLDNFETMQGAAAVVVDILRAAPAVKLLLTSRERPNLVSAWSFEVAGLDVPVGNAVEIVAASGSGQLFIRSARRAWHAFDLDPEEAPAVSRICALVEGLPLALELAASWTRTLPCAAVLAEIEKGIDFLATSAPDVPERHRSMRTVVDSSWELLTVEEQGVYSRLSVFPGSFTLQAAQQVAGATVKTLAILVDKSLLRRRADGRFAYHELLRQYGRERLAAADGELEGAGRQHAMYFLTLMGEQEQSLVDGDPEPALSNLEGEWANVQAAWQWAVEQSSVALVQSSANSLFWLCQWSNRYVEGKALFERAIAQFDAMGEPHGTWLATLLARCGRFYAQLADYESAEGTFTRSVPQLREAEGVPDLAEALDFWGDLERQRGAYAAAERILEESVGLYRGLDSPSGLARALGNLSAVVHRQGAYARARRLARESLELYKQTGNRRGQAAALLRMGYASYELGEFGLAEKYYTESLQLRQALGDQWGLARTYNNLGTIFFVQGAYERAERHFEQSLALRQALGDRRGTAITLINIGLIAATRQEYTRAEQHYQQSLDFFRQINDLQSVAIALNNLGEVAFAQERYEQAYSYHQESLAIGREIGLQRSVSYALEYLGLIALKLSRLDEARHHFVAALEIAWETEALPRVLHALHGLAQFHLRNGDTTQAADLFQIVATHPATEEHTRNEATIAMQNTLDAATNPANVADEELERTVHAQLAGGA